jgi:hypothetical protein
MCAGSYRFSTATVMSPMPLPTGEMIVVGAWVDVEIGKVVCLAATSYWL